MSCSWERLQKVVSLGLGGGGALIFSLGFLGGGLIQG